MTERKKRRFDIEGRDASRSKGAEGAGFAVLLFFVMSLNGWLWEVGLHLISSGNFVNRGFLRGPWLPIYGFGSLLIWALHRRLEGKPLQEFLAILLLCGLVEYGGSWLLERIYGVRWWDYSEYFLNLNGRICVEGLLVFGLGGMALAHCFVPFLLRLYRALPEKVLVWICLILILFFCGDLLCSVRAPNLGAGIARCG